MKKSYKVLYITEMAMAISGKRINYSQTDAEAIGYPLGKRK